MIVFITQRAKLAAAGLARRDLGGHDADQLATRHGSSSISPGRQVLLNHGSSGPYMRSSMFQDAPGIVCTQFLPSEANGLGPK